MNKSVGGCLFATLIFVLVVLFVPLLTIWCINTLFITPLSGSLLSYELFTWHWLAALLSGGVVFGLGKTNK